MSSARSAALITADQRRAARLIATAFALTSHEGLRAYEALRHVLARRLTSSERQGLAWAALGACSPEEAQGIAASLFDTEPLSSPPPPPLDPDDVTTEAQLWAEGASQAERLAYATAILQRLSADDRARVWDAAGARPLPSLGSAGSAETG